MLLRFSLADCILKAPYDTVPVTLKDKKFVKKIIAHFIIHAELLSELTLSVNSMYERTMQ